MPDFRHAERRPRGPDRQTSTQAEAMKGSGFSVSTDGLRKKLAKLGNVKASQFKPDVLKFVNVVLNTTTRNVPARDLSLIRDAQSKQYEHRVNYIPSFHTLEDPTLIVRPSGMMLFSGGKWYNPNLWNLAPDIWSQYEQLLAEHLRRMDTEKADSIADRAQARWLYKLTVAQCGASIGLKVIAPQAVLNSVTRRVPRVTPPRGYAQIRGGQTTISVVVYLPSIDDSTYRDDWDMGDILTAAIAQHRPAFLKGVEKHWQHIAYAVMANN